MAKKECLGNFSHHTASHESCLCHALAHTTQCSCSHRPTTSYTIMRLQCSTMAPPCPAVSPPHLPHGHHIIPHAPTLFLLDPHLAKLQYQFHRSTGWSRKPDFCPGCHFTNYMTLASSYNLLEPQSFLSIKVRILISASPPALGGKLNVC
jgi:hypothetical protein